jgi:uncharacterized protein YcaQ
MVDPLMDRKRGTLVVNAVHADADAPTTLTAGRSIASAIEDLARFLGAQDVEYRGPVPAVWRKAMS